MPPPRRDSASASRRRFGTGDVLVLASLGLLGVIAWLPHGDGRREARREEHAAQSLLLLAELLHRQHVPQELSAAIVLARGIEGLEQRLDYDPEREPGADAPGAGSAREPLERGQMLWDDGAYRYSLAARLPGHSSGRPPGLSFYASPRNERSGRIAYRGRPGVLEPVSVASPTPESEAEGHVQTHAQAQRTSLALLAILGERTSFWSRLEESLQHWQHDASAPALSDRYRYVLGFVPLGRGEASPVELELYAFPRRYGIDGHAAFRWTASRGLQQSRNLVLRYDDSRRPAPMAGVFRPGSAYDAAHSYTGLDGNQWLPFCSEADADLLLEFERRQQRIEQSPFAEQLAVLWPRLWDFTHKLPPALVTQQRFDLAALVAQAPTPRPIWTAGTEDGPWLMLQCPGGGEALLGPALEDERWTPALAAEALEIAAAFETLATPARALAEELGLDADRLLADAGRRLWRLGLVPPPPPPPEGAAPRRALLLSTWPREEPFDRAFSGLVFATGPSGEPRMPPREREGYYGALHVPALDAALPRPGLVPEPWEHYEGRDGLLWLPPPRQLRQR